jgi:hypothetical protein
VRAVRAALKTLVLTALIAAVGCGSGSSSRDGGSAIDGMDDGRLNGDAAIDPSIDRGPDGGGEADAPSLPDLLPGPDSSDTSDAIASDADTASDTAHSDGDEVKADGETDAVDGPGATCLLADAGAPDGPACNLSCPSGQVCAPGYSIQGGITVADDQCVNSGPSCVPDSGLCDATHHCCSGAPCCGGVCGGLCRSESQACDAQNACCRGSCTNGKCVPPCHLAGPFDACAGSGDPIACCGLALYCSGCGTPGASGGELFSACLVDGACQPGLACIGGVCLEYKGCKLPGMYAISEYECCSSAIYQAAAPGPWAICY